MFLCKFQIPDFWLKILISWTCNRLIPRFSQFLPPIGFVFLVYVYALYAMCCSEMALPGPKKLSGPARNSVPENTPTFDWTGYPNIGIWTKSYKECHSLVLTSNWVNCQLLKSELVDWIWAWLFEMFRSHACILIHCYNLNFIYINIFINHEIFLLDCFGKPIGLIHLVVRTVELMLNLILSLNFCQIYLMNDL